MNFNDMIRLIAEGKFPDDEKKDKKEAPEKDKVEKGPSDDAPDGEKKEAPKDVDKDGVPDDVDDNDGKEKPAFGKKPEDGDEEKIGKAGVPAETDEPDSDEGAEKELDPDAVDGSSSSKIDLDPVVSDDDSPEDDKAEKKSKDKEKPKDESEPDGDEDPKSEPEDDKTEPDAQGTGKGPDDEGSPSFKDKDDDEAMAKEKDGDKDKVAKPDPKKAKKKSKPLPENFDLVMRLLGRINEGDRGNDNHEHVLHKHGWEVSDTDGSGSNASYYHQDHDNHYVHVSHGGKWEHVDYDDDVVAKGRGHKSLAKHLHKFHGLNEHAPTRAHLRSLGVPDHHMQDTTGSDGDWVHIHRDDKQKPEVHKRIMASIKSGKLKVDGTDKGAVFRLNEGADDFVSSLHHSRMYHHHERQCRVLQRKLASGKHTPAEQKAIEKEIARHDARCAHHASQLDDHK